MGCCDQYVREKDVSLIVCFHGAKGVGFGRRPFSDTWIAPLGRPHFRYCASKALAIEWFCDNWGVSHLFVDALDGIGIGVRGDEEQANERRWHLVLGEFQ